MKPVEFADMDGGLWLDDYYAFERMRGEGMLNNRNWPGRILPGLCVALTIFLVDCKTSPVAEPATEPSILETIAPPLPPAPLIEPVEFADKDGGLWLSYNDYRSLERNIIALREYAARLEVIIEFYTEE
jgi:hypothetical protein